MLLMIMAGYGGVLGKWLGDFRAWKFYFESDPIGGSIGGKTPSNIISIASIFGPTDNGKKDPCPITVKSKI